MLQVKHLVKRYTTKGETVVALDGVSVDFPERGMVFLLGKSGSGKSTLLNVSGGLDSPDEGEVIVKGKSSKDFTQSDFDSYRNTYVGFIFQEYNILNEFTVEENVALALELQGKPRDEQKIREILEKVELQGYEKRRPNTLSGGQKQRVAIARALVKDPEIIMADEPTGALDSATGKQVFDTLKKLSEEKLVVVVSHDREFAEQYADRIIELKDGKIVSDVTRSGAAAEESNLVRVSEKELTVSCGAALTQDEMDEICRFLKNGKGSFVISSEKQAAKGASSGGFTATVQQEAAPAKDESNFIKSRFPLRHAFRMGFSGLRVKPFRLAFTVLLSTIAFIVFGVFSTLITFDQGKVNANALDRMQYGAAVVTKHGIAKMKNGTIEYEFQINTGNGNLSHFSQEETETLQEMYPQFCFVPAYTFNWTIISFTGAQSRSIKNPLYTNDPYYNQMKNFTAFADISALVEDGTYEILAGEYPETDLQIAVSRNVYETFRAYGYSANGASGNDVEPIASYEDLIGKVIPITLGLVTLYPTVTAVIDTHETFSRTDEEKAPSAFADEFAFSMSALCFVADGFYEAHAEECDVTHYTSEQVIKNFMFSSAGRYFVGSDFKEDEDAYCQYLFSPLLISRSAQCRALLRSIDGLRVEETGTVYDVPYEFTSEVAQGQMLVDKLTLTVGSAAGILALFSALLLYNFISASINAKKKDIGILRAVGARGTDVFKIFIFESALITAACFLLGCVGSLVVCSIVNAQLVAKAIVTVPIMIFDVANAAIVFAIALITALVATALPVRKTVKKKPVEAIRSL